ncbi:MAG TPA: acyl-CoA dehydrogenase family protein [Candidatus Binataceae bacterium]|jgi:alkylation response protein AidB-like acyl-CoA dehydrogenase|nr:acyl-CoA dehydrogenase family protein [Candidatus Binataceae bacterium]
MDFGLSDEQRQLRDSARQFLSNECPPAYVRKTMADEAGAARELYAALARLGWNGLIVPERWGGAGLGMLDMAVLLAEMGYAAMPGPFLFSAALAAAALVHGGSEGIKERWLRPLAAGEATGTVAITERADSLNPAELAATARREGAGWVLNGVKMFVPYAHLADFIVTAARTGPGPRDAGLFVVENGARGMRMRMLKGLDLTRRVCALDFDAVIVPPAAELAGGADLYARLLDQGAVAIAADSLGGMDRALEMAVEYSKVREQFGKPIGSFQALKHAAAEIVAELEPARALLWYAAYAQDALPQQAARAAAMAKARLSDIYMRGTDRAVLMHGGIGFTWDHDIHLWFKRARFNESCFGSPGYHRERVAALSGYDA